MSGMETHYDPGLVLLSLVVAVAAAYVALDLVGSVSQAKGRVRMVWLAGGALAMGFGIWSMHFIGMLAFRMPGVRMSYDVPLMLLSILVAVGASGFALSVMSRPRVARRALVTSAAAMAAAISGMHYLGMYSMRISAEISWNPALVALSLGIALFASCAAFVVSTRLRSARHPRRLQACASVLMGCAIAGMHYTGMEAATFRHLPGEVSDQTSVLPSSRLALVVTLSTLAVLALALGGAITDRAFARRKRSLRESRRRTRDAETASALKTRFLANMSHEIRTPLAAILGFAELLLAEDLAAADRRTYVRTILRSAESLSRLLDDVLDLSKIEMDRIDIERQALNLRVFVDDTLALLKIKADEKGLTLRLIDPGLAPHVITTDPARLRQVLTNILGNAIKFTARGEVTLTVGGESRADGHFVSFTVRDTGIGIAADHVTHLFKPFSQADSSMTRRFGGTGLGLDISRRLARALGGDVTLDSTALGTGSTFKISIAVDAGDFAAAPIEHRAAPDAAGLPRVDGLVILLVEDNPDNQTLITHVLKRQGARVDIAADGAAGVAAAASYAPDVILMDIQMPVMNGLEAMRTIRAAGSTTPVIALTAHALETEREACLRAGANEYLRKPINFGDLLRTINRLRA